MQNLFMYKDSKLDYISYFQMEMGYVLKNTDIIDFLMLNYGNVNIQWSDFSLDISVEDGLYDAIEIHIKNDYLEIKKAKHKGAIENIILFNKGSYMTIRQDKYCSLSEYDLIDKHIAEPIIKSLRYITSNELEKVFIIEKNIQLETGFTKQQHKELVKTLEHFVKDIYKMYNFKVKLQKFEYFTLDFYLYGRLGRLDLEINPIKYEDCSAVFDYNQNKEYTTIVSNNQGTLHLFPTLLNTAYRIHKYRAYTLYDRKLLLAESEKLKNSGVING